MYVLRGGVVFPTLFIH